MHTPLYPVPKGTKKGWSFLINNELAEVDSLDGFHPRVGHLRYGFNGRFDQPAFEQNPGRLVVYICDHPVHGLLMGGAEEPRQLANGTMFTPAGGFDPEANSAELEKIRVMPNGEEKNQKLAEYGKKAAAREILEEMGLDPTDLKLADRFVSNRALFIVDLKDDPSRWNGETVYVCVVDSNLLSDDLTIRLPEDKLGDVMPAPEWSSIQKLQFKSVLDCFASPDGVAVAAYAKAYRWWELNHK